MIRRLNYTGRVKLHRSDIHLISHEGVDGPSFGLELQVADYDLPPDAMVFIEAYRETTWMRFAFGTVANISAPAPEQLLLNEFGSADGIHFRIKITQAQDEHILLATADGIPLTKPEEDANSESLLPVVPKELGDELWRVDLENEPLLLVNKSASADWKQMARSWIFLPLVAPAAFREVLKHILASDYRDLDDDVDWRSQWLRFAISLPGINPEPPKDPEDAVRWADDAIAAFAKKLSFKEKFSGAWLQEEGK